MTADFIRFHAAERPEAVALVNEGREITYARFAGDIGKFVRGLRDLGVARGAKVAIDCRDIYLDWLLRLACEELSAVSTSFAGRDALRPRSGLRDFDLVLSESGIRAKEVRRFHAISPEWTDGMFARAEEGEGPAPVKRPDDPLRILRTSGTTGIPKRLLYSRRMHERSIAQSMWFNGFTRRSRYLLAIPFTVGAPAACVRLGATVVFESRMRVPEAIMAHGITHTTLPPILLMRTLESLESGFVKPADLKIFCFGAAISRGLRDKALAGLATGICDMYGSNEVGFVSSARCAGEPGVVWPGVRVEIVDDRDRALPLGQLGRIRIGTDCMVEGYLDDPEATRRMFRDGWFYPGDLGILQGPRLLQVVGRSDDLLNIGWNKIMPETVEALILEIAEVADAGVCSLPNADGIEEICIAVSGVRIGDPELAERIGRALGRLQLGKVHVLKLRDIPRNDGGKIERDRLKSAVAKLHRAS
jgi:acyl-coenzyme A synthetase/AMP-(fatty) acid ligase